MKNLAVLTMVALFGLGLVNGTAVAQETPPPTTAAATPAPPTATTHQVEMVEKTPLSAYHLTLVVIGLLTVIAILLALGLSQVSGIKAGIDKLANK